MTRLETLARNLGTVLGGRIAATTVDRGEVTIVVPAAAYAEAATLLRDDPLLRFEQLIDLAGVDYLDYAGGSHGGARFAVVGFLMALYYFYLDGPRWIDRVVRVLPIEHEDARDFLGHF